MPFTRTFEGSNAIPRDVLLARLGSPGELSGLLNKALQALPGLKANGFIQADSLRSAWEEFRRTTNPVAVWFDHNLVEHPEALVSKQALRDAYSRDADTAGRPRLTDKALGQAVKRHKPQIQEAQRTVGGTLQWCWLGIGLRSESRT